MAALGGAGAALILLAMPVGLIELVVASSGISESVPAAAPPLGLKARLLLAAFGALMAIGFVWMGQKGPAAPRRTVIGRGDRVPGVSGMGFALSKLSWLSRGRNGTAARGGRPALRRADAHPDAPVRAPIFASRDFGGLEIFPGAAPLRPVVEVEEAPVVLALPRMAPPEPEPLAIAESADAGEEILAAEPIIAPSVVQADPLPAPTLSELTARLERGLARRERGTRGSTVLADMPVEPAVPVRAQVEHDVDEALRAALGTLRAMASRTR